MTRFSAWLRDILLAAILLSPVVLIGLSCLTQRVYGAATAPAIVGWCC